MLTCKIPFVEILTDKIPFVAILLYPDKRTTIILLFAYFPCNYSILMKQLEYIDLIELANIVFANVK